MLLVRFTWVTVWTFIHLYNQYVRIGSSFCPVMLRANPHFIPSAISRTMRLFSVDHFPHRICYRNWQCIPPLWIQMIDTLSAINRSVYFGHTNAGLSAATCSVISTSSCSLNNHHSIVRPIPSPSQWGRTARYIKYPSGVITPSPTTNFRYIATIPVLYPTQSVIIMLGQNNRSSRALHWLTCCCDRGTKSIGDAARTRVVIPDLASNLFLETIVISWRNCSPRGYRPYSRRM